MEQKIMALKRAILELERDKLIKSKGEIIQNIDDIINLCEEIKNNLPKKSIDAYNNIKCSKINTIPFIYKPVLIKNYFEGDYIVKFAEARSQDLKKARALDAHNEFWIQHKTIKGNIFGSVPKELLKEESIKSLVRSGWREAEVDIFDIEDCVEDTREIISFCENKFKYYILIQEELTNSYLILNYKIS